MKKPKHKYYRVTANSMTSYEYYIKVPDTITPDDIWQQRGDHVLDRFFTDPVKILEVKEYKND
jgi:hypothetical protein